MATIRNERDIQLQATTPRLLSIDSNYVTVIPSTTIFSTGATGIVPSSISVLASFTGVLRGTVTWSSSPSIPMSISGNTVTINGSNVPVGTSVTVTATLAFLGVNYQSSTVITHAPVTPSYKLISTANNIINNEGVFTPASVQFLARSVISGELAAYNGRFIVDISTNGSTYTTLYTSGVNESSYTYTPNATHKLVRVRLYQAGGTTILLDQVTIGISNESSTDLSNVLLKNAANILTGTIVPQDSGALKVGTITWNSTTGALTGGTGLAMTEWGLIGANAGVPKFTIEAATGNATFAGEILGGANISITGQGLFNGSTSDPNGSFSIVANQSLGSSGGIIAYSGSISYPGVWGVASSGSSSSAGVLGWANGNNTSGIIGFASGPTKVGIKAQGILGATALSVEGTSIFSGVVSFSNNITQSAGTTQLRTVNISTGGITVNGTSSLQSTNFTGNITQGTGTSQLRSLTINSGGLTVTSGSTSVGALSCSTFSTSSTSTVSNLSADMVDGFHANSFSRQFGTNFGTALPSSGIIRILVSGITGVTSTGSSNIVSIESTSDIRLKTDIKEETKGLNFIQTLKPVTYRWKDKRDKLTYHGFIAQDIENIDVCDNDALRYINETTGYEGVDYISLVPILVKSIQELTKEVQELREKIK